MKATEVNPEATRIAIEIYTMVHVGALESEIEKYLNLFPLSPYWAITHNIMNRQQKYGIKII